MRTGIAGILLFLFIPFVLYIYIAQPFGVLWSLALGLAVMIGHRFIAAPFSARHRSQRCLWCGRHLPGARASLDLRVRVGETASFAFCPPSSDPCRRRWVGLHRLAVRNKFLIRMGIFIPLLIYLVAETARGFGVLLIPQAVSLAIFKGIIALTVVTVSFAYLSHSPEEDSAESPQAPFPFPLHNLSLLGARWTLWIFRLVGIWWLLQLISELIRFLG